MINIMGGCDLVSSLKQLVQFGLNKQMAVGGTLFELECIRAAAGSARVGMWMYGMVLESAGRAGRRGIHRRRCKKITGGKRATARNWFGYAVGQSLP